MASNMKLGGGGRFRKLASELADKPDVRDPNALAAAIGRAKLGKQRMAQMSAAGRRRAS